MNPVNPESRDRILTWAKEHRQLADALNALASVKEEDLAKIAKFLIADPEPSILQLHQFFSGLLDYLPTGTYLSPWLAIQSICFFARQESIEPTDVLEILMAEHAPDHNLKPLKGFLRELKPALERLDISLKSSFFVNRNTRLLNSAVTACDLRAVFKEDFSLAATEATYNPILDFDRFAPVAKVRLTFDAAGNDYFDFACDLNMLEMLIHSLDMTKKQLKALQKIASKLESED